MPGQPTTCSDCQLFTKGRGFCLGTGDPVKAKLAFVLEAVSDSEIGFWLNTPMMDVIPSPKDELLRRQAVFPLLEKSALVKGVAASGRAGTILNNWLLPKVGIVRSECFIDSVIRCVPPRSKTGAPYPTGADKTSAERTCRQYDRLKDFAPDAVILTFHPASLMRELTILPLILKDLEKAQSFVKQGLRTLVLMGGHAADVYAGWGSNLARFRGDYFLTSRYGGPDAWYERVLARVASKSKTKKKSKSAQLASGNASVLGDVLDIQTVKVRKKPGCKAILEDETGATFGICGKTKDEHPTATCPNYQHKKSTPPLHDRLRSVVVHDTSHPNISGIVNAGVLGEDTAKGEVISNAL